MSKQRSGVRNVDPWRAVEDRTSSSHPGVYCRSSLGRDCGVGDLALVSAIMTKRFGVAGPQSLRASGVPPRGPPKLAPYSAAIISRPHRWFAERSQRTSQHSLDTKPPNSASVIPNPITFLRSGYDAMRAYSESLLGVSGTGRGWKVAWFHGARCVERFRVLYAPQNGDCVEAALPGAGTDATRANALRQWLRGSF